MSLSKVLGGLFLSLLFVCGSSASGPGSGIFYTLDDLGGGHYQYNYRLTNLSLSNPVSEVTILFDHALYANLATTTDPAPAGWDDGDIIQPRPLTTPQVTGQYNIWATGGGLLIGQSAKFFSVTFDWLSTDIPGGQPYEIVDPLTWETVASGYTIPEPLSVALLMAGTVLLARKRRA